MKNDRTPPPREIKPLVFYGIPVYGWGLLVYSNEYTVPGSFLTSLGRKRRSPGLMDLTPEAERRPTFTSSVVHLTHLGLTMICL